MTQENYLKAIEPHYTGYQELHVHTDASFRDAVTKVEEIVAKTQELGRNAFAITDHGNQMRLFHGFKARTNAEKKALKKELQEYGVAEDEIEKILKTFSPTDSMRCPNEKMWEYIEKYPEIFIEAVHNSPQYVPGIELYFQPEKEYNKERYHIILYACDWQGQKELFKIQNLAQLNPGISKDKLNPVRTTWADLERLCGPGTAGHKHIIATSACVGGYIPSLLLKPWNIAEKQMEFRMKMEHACETYSMDDLTAAENRLATAVENESNAKLRLKVAKKAEKTNYDAKIARQQKKIDKLQAVVEHLQTSFFEMSMFANEEAALQEKAKDDETLTKLQTELAAMEAIKEEQQLAATIDKTTAIREAEQAKEAVKAAKEYLAIIKKALRPLDNLNGKIKELDKEREKLGDTFQQAKDAAMHMEQIFGKGYFYIELQDHNIVKEKQVLPLLYRLIQETGIPPTVANDVHYASPADKHKRDMIAAMRFSKPIPVRETENQEGMAELYFKSNEQMAALHEEEIWQQGMENTSRIAEKCNVYYKKEMHLPEFDAKAAGYDTPKMYLEAYCRKRIPYKYPINVMPADQRDKLLKAIDNRLKYELDVIEQMGFSSYIAIVQDFIFYGRSIGGPAGIGPGRGSAAGSLVCYLADITDIDPLRFDLLFERFLNPQRVSMPDIDTDIAPSIRNKVVDYIAKKYAYTDEYPIEELKGTVCNIVTESLLTARAAVRAAARVMEVPYDVGDRVAKLIPKTPGISLDKALEDSLELQALLEQNIQAKQLFQDAKLVEGIPTHTGMHAAGVIIADKPVSEYAPLLYNEDEHCWVIELDKVDCEMTAGLLKMDALGLKNLDIIKAAIFYVKKAEGQQGDFEVLRKADDPRVFQNIYAKGDTHGIFQFESEGITKSLVNFNPKTIDDVILMNAAYRPGPMQFIPDVTAVKNGEKEPNYIVPEMADILGVTYGSAIYQEQIQQIFHNIAGFTMGEADIIRRAMAKKHLHELESAKPAFVNGLLKKGATAEDVETFWEQLLEFAKYAFNHSHAAAYSIVSYYTAWLKEYHPAAFLAATMSYSGLDKIPMYALDCKKKNIPILQPDINTGVPFFAPTVGAKEIRYGLASIMGVANAAQTLCDTRRKHGPVLDYRDLILRACIYGISSTALENLVKTGAVDSIMKPGEHRKMYVDNFKERILECRKAIKTYKNNAASEDEEIPADQVYDALSQSWEMNPLFDVEPYGQVEMLSFERKLLGIYISGSPVDPYIKDIQNSGRDKAIGEVEQEYERISLTGLVRDITVIHRKSDGAPLAKFVLEDETGSIDVVMFTKRYGMYHNDLEPNTVAKITGRVNIEEDDTDDFEDVEKTKQLVVNDYFRIK